MKIKVTENTVPARLKLPEGKLLEVGRALISVENRSVDFLNDFVQLFKMDTPLIVVTLKDGLEVHSFSGLVYLSSQTLLRLVEVKDELLPGAKLAYTLEVALDGALRASLTEDIRGGLFHSQRRSITGERTLPVEIHGLSMQHVNFTCRKVIEKGQFVQLSIPAIGVRDMILEIDKSYKFGRLTTNYHCTIKELSPQSRIALDAYVCEQVVLQHKLF